MFCLFLEKSGFFYCCPLLFCVPSFTSRLWRLRHKMQKNRPFLHLASFWVWVLDLFGRSCPGKEVVVSLPVVSDVTFLRVLGQALWGHAGHVVAQMRSRGNKPIPWRGSRETACSNLFVFITSVNKNGERSKRRDCVRCWLHSIVSYRISFVVLLVKCPLSFLRLQNSFGKMSIQPHAWLKHAVLLYSS